MTRIVYVDRIYVLESEYPKAHGIDDMDDIGKESFINHVHVEGENRMREASGVVTDWEKQMKENWPGVEFRIYLNECDDETIVRFHAVRDGSPNWSEASDKTNKIICVA